MEVLEPRENFVEMNYFHPNFDQVYFSQANKTVMPACYFESLNPTTRHFIYFKNTSEKHSRNLFFSEKNDQKHRTYRI